MTGAISTFHLHPSHLKTDLHIQPSPLAIPFTKITLLRQRSSHDYRSSSSRLVRRSSNSTAVDAPSATIELESAANVVRKFYDSFNRRDLASLEEVIALDCVYEDLIFSKPFVGRKAIIDFFKQFMDLISADLKFAVDDIAEEDTSVIGVMWHLDRFDATPGDLHHSISTYPSDAINLSGADHLEHSALKWKGKPFPFSRGCSFYRLGVVDGRRQILFGRDAVEPAIKPGETALVVISGVTWLLQKFPFLADRL